MKSRYKALGVPKTPVFILETTKIRPMKPRRDVPRETMSRNARLGTRDCNVSTSTLQALRIRQRPVSHKRTRFETFSSQSAKRHRRIASKARRAEPRAFEFNSRRLDQSRDPHQRRALTTRYRAP